MSIAYSELPLRLVRDEEAPTYDGQRRSGSFVMIPTDVGAAIMGTLGVSAFGVYWHLARRSNGGKCWPSLDDIAEATTLSRKHVTRMLDALEEGGWITRTRRTNNFKMATSTMYELPHLSRTYGCDITETSLGHDTPRNVTVTRVELNRELKEIPTSPKAPKKPAGYSEAFEAFWSAYPTGHGVKKLASAEWEKLSADEQGLVMAALPEWHGCDKWRDGFIREAQRWLSYREWESPPPASAIQRPKAYQPKDPRTYKSGELGVY